MKTSTPIPASTAARSGSPVAPAEPLTTRLFPHPHQRRVIDTVVSAVIRPGGKQFVAVFGPPGAGKSRTWRIVENALAHHWRASMESDPNIRPVVSVEAPAPIGREFPWGEFAKELLAALRDEGIDRLIGEISGSGRRPDRAIRPGRLGRDETFRIAVRRYRRHGVRVLLIDEAQHMGVAPGASELKHNLDILKSFANKTGVRVVLFGTYEVLAFHSASAQLARRILDVHLPRYHWDRERERLAFWAVTRDMLEAIGLPEAEIAESIPACYERSLGCVGELHDWLVQAAFEYEATGRKDWGKSLAMTAPSASKAHEILLQILEAERLATDSGRVVDRLRALLGLTEQSVAREPKSPNRGGRRVGRRAPTRDAVAANG